MNELCDLTVDRETLRVTNRESERREFKSTFDKDSLWKYAQTIAAFANRDGGIIFFGIKNAPRMLLGFSEAEPEDLVFANFMKEHFEPNVSFELDSKIIHEKKILYILVQPSPEKPIICRKNKVQQFREKGKADEQLLREGAIYYRYSSSNGEIKYPELKKILDGKVKKVFDSFVKNMTLINEVGHDRAAVVDAAAFEKKDKTATVYITNETARNMNWISKGRFKETDDDAERAFYVVKEVEIKHGLEIEKEVPTDPSKTHPLTKTALTYGTSISSSYINSILWKLNLLDDPQYHFGQVRGRQPLHNFTNSAKDKILASYPLDMIDRKNKIKNTHREFLAHQKKDP